MKKKSKIIVTGIIGIGVIALTASICIPWYKRTEFEKARNNLEADLPAYAEKVLCSMDMVTAVDVTTNFSLENNTKRSCYEFSDDITYKISVENKLDSLDEFDIYDYLHEIDDAARSIYSDLLYSDSNKYKAYQQHKEFWDIEFYNIPVYFNQDVQVVISTDNNSYEYSKYSYYTKNNVTVNLDDLKELRDFQNDYTEIESSSPWVGTWENSYFAYPQRTTKIYSKDDSLYLCVFVDDDQVPISIAEYPGDSATRIYDFNEYGDLVLKSYNELQIPSYNSETDLYGTYTFVRVGSGLEAPTQMTINNNSRKEPSIGMTADEVKLSTWGKPTTINRTTTEYGVSEQWVYGTKGYIYLENGIVTAIQD